MDERSLPEHVACRADVDALLAAATNYEEKLPRDPLKKALDLGRVGALFASVGDPQVGPRTFHVAGSKGKGTVARLVAAGLVADPGRGPVGLYTSPHLEDLSERIAIDGTPVAEAAFAAAADRLLPHLRATQGTREAPTFFEIMTAVAWLAFRAAGCTDVVLETGLGGRLDATTVCHPAVTVITPIELEHTRLLGDTIALIAAEKAAILKPGVPAITTATGEALDVIRAHAAEVGAPLTVLGEDAHVRDAVSTPGPCTRFRLEIPRQGTWDLRVPLAGAHHASNAAAAFLALRSLGVEAGCARDALAGAVVPGVLEEIARAPILLIDGAHTPVSARATRAGLEAGWPGRPHVLLTAMLREKDVAAVAGALADGATHVVTTQMGTPRAAPADELAAEVRAVVAASVEAVADPYAALARARKLAGVDGLVLCSGSVYLAGTIRTLARP